MVKTLLEPFTKKKSKSKVMIFHLIVGLIKKYCYTKWIIFPNNIPVVKKINFELYLTNDAKKLHLKNATGVNT